MEAYKAHKGDPILSANGDRIVAIWRKSRVFESSVMRFHYLPRLDGCIFLERVSMEGCDFTAVEVKCALSTPALSVWRFASRTIDENEAVAYIDSMEPYDRMKLAARTLQAARHLPYGVPELIDHIAKHGWGR